MSKKEMRDSVALVKAYQKYFPEEYSFFRHILVDGYKNNCKFFLGARDNYLNIYYMGQSIAKIEIPFKNEKRRRTKYTVANYIVFGDAKKGSKIEGEQSYVSLGWKEYRDAFDQILCNARSNALGKRKGAKQQSIHREKICQQNIINHNNVDKMSDWYYIDMEYIDAVNPCGRVDMVAIRKSKNDNGKHEVSLVELKVGSGAYGCSIYKYGERKDIYDKLAINLYIPEYRKYKYGSGILSHIADYLRYLYDNRYKEQLRKEIVLMLKVHEEFGVLNDDNSLVNIKEVDLEDKPHIYILSCTHDPLINEEKESINALKDEMYKYLYSKPDDRPLRTSERALEKMLNKEQVNGFIEKKEEFIESEKEDVECIQSINGEDYSFVFRFWDPDKHRSKWNCLY